MFLYTNYVSKLQILLKFVLHNKHCQKFNVRIVTFHQQINLAYCIEVQDPSFYFQTKCQNYLYYLSKQNNMRQYYYVTNENMSLRYCPKHNFAITYVSIWSFLNTINKNHILTDFCVLVYFTIQVRYLFPLDSEIPNRQ